MVSYGKEYYLSDQGNYHDRVLWEEAAGRYAKRIIDDLHPESVLDIGCAFGYMVQMLREQGVDAWGIDNSEYAIGQAAESVRPYLRVSSATDPLPQDMPQHYDLILNIEVLEHMSPEDGDEAIRLMCTYGNRVFFSSTCSDIDNPYHINVQQAEYWAERFARNGFYRDTEYSTAYLSPDSAVFMSDGRDMSDVVAEYERVIRKQKELVQSQEQVIAELVEDNRNKEDEPVETEQIRYDFDYKAAYEEISSSACWRATKPVRVILTFFGRCARLMRRLPGVLKNNGLRGTLIKVRLRLRQRRAPGANPPQQTGAAPVQIQRVDMSEDPVDGIQSIIVNEPVKRLNLVTDSINSGSLFGGVATSLILATEFANANRWELRVITRMSPVDPGAYMKIMKINGIEPAQKISFYSDFELRQGFKGLKLELSRDDIFMATSWWSVEAIRKTGLQRRMFYILQEVEPFFYCHGPMHFLATMTMRDPDITYIVNSHYLFDYFKVREPNVTANGISFEPAFSKALYRCGGFTEKKKYRLFFYARPQNPRNMFSYGINLLNKAFNEGILNPDEWEICCAGQEIPAVEFDCGAKAQRLGVLSWTKYSAFLQTVDLALCLMYTPHPSYPPYDVASSGGVVVTNRFANKQTFPQCANVLMGGLDEESMLRTLADGIALAKDMKRRELNYSASAIPCDWHETLRESVDFMTARMSDV